MIYYQLKGYKKLQVYRTVIAFHFELLLNRTTPSHRRNSGVDRDFLIELNTSQYCLANKSQRSIERLRQRYESSIRSARTGGGEGALTFGFPRNDILRLSLNSRRMKPPYTELSRRLSDHFPANTKGRANETAIHRTESSPSLLPTP